MAIVCLPHGGFLSETSRMIAVYKALKARGAPCILASHGGTYEYMFDREGVPWEPIEPRLTEADCKKTLGVVVKPYKPLFTPDELEQHVRAEREFFVQRGAKAVLCGFTLSAALSTRAAKVPYATTQMGSFVPIIFDKKRVVVDTLLENWFTRLLPSSWLRALATWGLRRVRWQCKQFNEVARRVGADPMLSLLDILQGDVTLVSDVPEILGISEEELEGWRPPKGFRLRPTLRMKYVGALYANFSGQIPPEVSSFLATDRPKVYVAMTSTWREYLERVYEVLSGMDVAALIVSTRHTESLASTDKILVTDFLPSHRVMPLCDLVIIHGGQGSVQTAIASGTPLIGFPLQPEQNLNLQTVEDHGAGRCLSWWSLKKGRLPGVIEEVLADDSYRQAMAKLQEYQARRNGPDEVARILWDLAESGA